MDAGAIEEHEFCSQMLCLRDPCWTFIPFKLQFGTSLKGKYSCYLLTPQDYVMTKQVNGCERCFENDGVIHTLLLFN